MKDEQMLKTEFKEALEVAIDTHSNIEFKGKEEADQILFKSLGQILHTLQSKLKIINGST